MKTYRKEQSRHAFQLHFIALQKKQNLRHELTNTDVFLAVKRLRLLNLDNNFHDTEMIHFVQIQ